MAEGHVLMKYLGTESDGTESDGVHVRRWRPVRKPKDNKVRPGD